MQQLTRREARSSGPPTRLFPPPCGGGLLLCRLKWRLRLRRLLRLRQPKQRRPGAAESWYLAGSCRALPSTSALPARPRSACACTACRPCSPSSRLSALRECRICGSAPVLYHHTKNSEQARSSRLERPGERGLGREEARVPLRA